MEPGPPATDDLGGDDLVPERWDGSAARRHDEGNSCLTLQEGLIPGGRRAIMHRRPFLAGIGVGVVSLTGCTSISDTERTGRGTNTTSTGEDTDLPEDCEMSQGIDVEWPEHLDASAVESFVEAYEQAYYRDVVIEYTPESELDTYELAGGVTDGPTDVGNGWELSYAGGGGIYRPTLLLGATRTDPPDGADLVPVGEIDEDPVTELLEEAAAVGEATHHIEPPGETVDRHVELFASLSDDFERLSGPGEDDTLYVDVDGTPVKLDVTATNRHGDYDWRARYYVDEHVVRRATGEDTDPRDGTLLECREDD